MDSLFAKISANRLRQAASIVDQIHHLERKLAQVLGSTSERPTRRIPKSRINRAAGLRIASGTKTRRRRRKMNAAAKKRLSAIAKQRWKKAKASGKTTL